MTSNDLDLDERDNEEPDDYPPAERVIRTQGYDLSIKTLVEQWNDNTLIVPDFQREYVWDNPKASRLIESLVLNIPIPVLFFSENDQAQHEIVDGHQRVLSIVRYVDNQFALSGLRISQEFKGKRFHRLPPREQRFLMTRVMRAIVISEDSSPTMKFEVFERLNTGGLSLNAQEIRNAIYRGPFNELLKELEKVEAFRQCLGAKKPRKRMVDRELVLRFLALSDEFGEYRTPLLRFLNDYMRDNQKASNAWLGKRRDRFVQAVTLASDVFGSAAFRVIDASGNPTEKNVNRALFDTQMLVLSASDHTAARENREQLVHNVAGLFAIDSFQNAIRRATGDKARVHERVKDMVDAFERAGVKVDRRRFPGLKSA